MNNFLDLPPECIVKTMNNIDPYTTELSFKKVCMYFYNLYKTHYLYNVFIGSKVDNLNTPHVFVKIYPKKDKNECLVDIIKKYHTNIFFASDRLYLDYCHYNVNVLKERNVVYCDETNVSVSKLRQISTNTQKHIYEKNELSQTKFSSRLSNEKDHVYTSIETKQPLDYEYSSFNTFNDFCITCNILSFNNINLLHEDSQTILFEINKDVTCGKVKPHYILVCLKSKMIYKFDFDWKIFNFNFQQYLYNTPEYESNFIKNLKKEHLKILNNFSILVHTGDVPMT